MFAPRPGPSPTSSSAPLCSGYRPSWCSEIVSTSGSRQKAFWVPLPWCTSQSTTAIRPTPRVARRWRAAIAMLPSMQKPRPVSGSAWCPGGRTSAYTELTRPSSTASAATMQPPAESRATSRLPGPNGVPSPASPPAPGARLLEPLEVAGLVQAEDLLVRRGARCEVHQLAGEATRVEQVPQAPLRLGRLPVRVLLDHGRARLHHARVVPEVALVEHEADRRHADSLRTRSATHASSAARSPSLTNTSSASTRASASGSWSGLRRSKRSGPRARRISSGALISTVRS